MKLKHVFVCCAVAAGGANPLALLVAPLAGIALMTAAAAVAISPVLLTVSLTGKRRRRRDTETEMDQGISPQLEEKMHEIQVGKNFFLSRFRREKCFFVEIQVGKAFFVEIQVGKRLHEKLEEFVYFVYFPFRCRGR
jgi:hypothetical protein